MNQYYAIYGNEAKVIDENDNTTTKEVTENFDTILIKENEKEAMEYQLERTQNTIKEIKPKLKKLKKGMLFFSFGGVALGITLYLILMLIARDFSVLYSFKSIVTSASASPFVLIPTLAGIYFGWVEHFDLETKRKMLNAAELQSYFLEKEIPLKEQELEKLKENSQKIEISNKQLDIEKVDDRETLIKLREYLEKLGEYGKKISKYANRPLSEKDKETIRNDGIDPDLFESYLMEYNIRELKRSKMVSWF